MWNALRKNWINLLLIAAFALFLWLMKAFYGFFVGSSDNIKAATITAVVSVSIFTLGRYFEQRREDNIRINTEKIEVYRRFFDFYFSVMHHDKLSDEPRDPKAILKEMLFFQKDVIFWGSDEVIRSYLDFKDCISEFSSEDFSLDSNELPVRLAKVMGSVARVLVAMRRDVGYAFTSISATDLARLQLAGGPDEKRVFEYL